MRMGKKKAAREYLASSVLLDENEGASIVRNTFALQCGFSTFLRELLQIPAGVVAFLGS